jgi:hypothetical protein
MGCAVHVENLSFPGGASVGIFKAAAGFFAPSLQQVRLVQGPPSRQD